MLQQESDSVEPNEEDQLASAFIPADAKLKKNQLKKQEIYSFDGRDYTAFQHEVDLDMLRQWHKRTTSKARTLLSICASLVTFLNAIQTA